MKAKRNLPRLNKKRKEVTPTENSGGAENSVTSERFLQDLATREEALELGKGGKLPSQATHVITKKNPDGTIQVKRARFKLV